LLWFGSDEHTWAPKVPLYGGATLVHRTYDDNNCSSRIACRIYNNLPGNMLNFSWESAYWVNSAVAKLVYSEKSKMQQTVLCAKQDFENWVLPLVSQAENDALECFNSMSQSSSSSSSSSSLSSFKNEEDCVEPLTSLAITATEQATLKWTELWQSLMVTFIDGYTTTVDEDNMICGCNKQSSPYDETYLKKVVNDTGDHYRMPDSDCTKIDADGHCVTSDDDDAGGEEVNVKSMKKPRMMNKLSTSGV
jgi:hypothetical protein